MWHEFAIALCLLLVIEGVLPFLNPSRWRSMMQLIAQLDDRSIRIAGLCSMLLGVALLYVVNG